MTEGKIVSWIKSEGDKLSKGESVVVVESDKADMDVESFYDGYLAAIFVDEGLSAAVGSTIALLAETEEEIALAQSKKTSSSAPAPAPPAANSDAPKVLDEMPSPVPAAAATPALKASATVNVSALGSAAHPASEGGKRVVASPFAKKLAKDLGVDLRGVVGSGPNGRVVAKDVEAALASGKLSGGGAAVPASEAPKPSGVVPFTTMQSAVSRNMIESLAVPTFRVGYTINTDALDALYKKVISVQIDSCIIFLKILWVEVALFVLE